MAFIGLLIGILALGIPIFSLIIGLMNRSKLEMIRLRYEESVKQLHMQIRQLQLRLNELETHKAEPTAPPPIIVTESSPSIVKEIFQQPDTELPAANVLSQAAPVASKPEPAPVVYQTPVYKEESKGWETFVGGKLLNRIGAVALILGMLFFLKYAFDNNIITETGRCILGLVVGAGLLGGAVLARSSGYKIFMQGVLAAGITIEYLTIYVAGSLYHIVSPVTGFIGLSIVTVITLLLAYRLDSIVAVYIGWAGGFLTPFLAGVQSDSPWGMYAYLLVLNAGLLWLIHKKDEWASIEPFALGATYICFFLWYDQFVTKSMQPVFASFVVAVWLVYLISDLLRSRSDDSGINYLRQTVQALAGALTIIGLIVVYEHDNNALAGVLVSLSPIYLITAWIVSKREGIGNFKWEFPVLAAAIYFSIAILFYFSGFTIIALWTLVGLAIITISTFRGYESIARYGFGWFVVAFAGWLLTRNALWWTDRSTYTLILNSRCGTLLLLVTTAGAALPIARRLSGVLTRELTFAIGTLIAFGVFLLVTVETVDAFGVTLRSLYAEHNSGNAATIDSLRNMQQLSLSLVWLAYSIIAMVVGLWFRTKGLRLASILVCGISILKIFIVDLSWLDTFYRMISFFVLGGILLSVSFLYQKYKHILLAESGEEDVNP